MYFTYVEVSKVNDKFNIYLTFSYENIFNTVNQCIG